MKSAWFNIHWILGTLLTGIACTSVEEYSTASGECFEGNIVAADYLRTPAFSETVKLRLTLDADSLGECDRDATQADAGIEICREGGRITTSDNPPTFLEAPIRARPQLVHDSLSLLQFPSGRVRNYWAYAIPTQGPGAEVIVSLMENDEVEVRILRPPGNADAPELFGVFRLFRKEGCNTPFTQAP